ncbi:MAG: ribosome biogenesis GTP-binding protein YihA/YsxC [Lachnospiraceae bacterium]
MKPNIQKAELKITAGDPRQFPRDPIPQIAFSGRSNVGKSSLVNSLLGRKSLARVSSSPGKTITVNFYDVDRKLYLVDLPGYGFAKRTFEEKKKWSALTDGYLPQIDSDLLKLVVQLVDSRISLTSDDRNMLAYLSQCQIPHVIVATKTDKLNAAERKKFVSEISECAEAADADCVIMYSAKNGEGRDNLWIKIFEFAEV